jgi:antitoxin component YwqK of YwqJK toxin-antitoxin module
LNGLRNGKWTTWHENGQKLSELNWKEGLREGKMFIWNNNGQKEYMRIYKDDSIVSEARYTYYSNGQMKELSNYKGNQWDGKFTNWREDGELKSEFNYKDNMRHGKFTWFDRNGQLETEGIYEEDVCISGWCLP